MVLEFNRKDLKELKVSLANYDNKKKKYYKYKFRKSNGWAQRNGKQGNNERKKRNENDLIRKKNRRKIR